MNAHITGLLGCLAALIAFVPACLSQNVAAEDALIASRQAEVSGLARKLYRLDVQPDWTHERVELCPAFTHHVFALYRSPAKNARASFVAVYPVPLPPSSSSEMPWQGGILLLPHEGIPTHETPVFADRASVRGAFNRVWAEERAAGQAALDRGTLAACFARFAGEAPMVSQRAEPINVTAVPERKVGNVQVPLMSQAGGARWLALEFDGISDVTASKVKEIRAEHVR